MKVFADFLDTHAASILDRFSHRVPDVLAAHPAIRDRMLGRLPTFLGDLAGALRASADAPSAFAPPPFGEAAPTEALEAVIEGCTLIGDCIFDVLATVGVTPSPHAVRLVVSAVARMTMDAVARFASSRQAQADFERRHLLDLFEQAPGFLCFLRGRDQVFELANPAYYQLIGHRDVIGKPLRVALPEIAGQGFFELVERVFETGEPFVGRGMLVLLQRTPNAPLTQAYVDLVYQPIRDPRGMITGILAQGHEITEAKLEQARRELAEEALRSSEERYRTLFESIDDGYGLLEMIFDATGRAVDYRFLEVNAAFEKQTGLLDAVGRTARELVPDLDESWFQLYGDVARTGNAIRKINHAPAMDRWFEVYASRVGPAERRQVALVFKDITDRKKVEAERENLLALESNARRAAEEAGRMRDEFLATVSHELRTPLASILGWAQMLRGETLPPAKRAQALETIERNARAQAQLIEDLLDVSRILSGKLRIEVEPTDMRSIVELALETVRPAAEAKQLRLQPALATGATVMGDPQRLQQVVWNLLSNAVKFTPKGGRIQVVVQTIDSSVVIRVADSGLGIPKPMQSQIFERFRQVDSSTTRSHGGLGLGLAIVKQLVDLHGGVVAVESEGDGSGATFTIRLPLAAARRREIEPPPDAPLPRGIACPPELAGLRLVIVDDENDTREMLKTMLETCGAHIRAAGSAADALALIREERPDVLVSDIGMPGADGYELIGKVRSLAKDAGGDVPAIALTAYARSQDRTRALLAGFNNHVAKPVEPLELLAVISSLVARSAKSQAE